jgi:histone acetyltransferase (RNA polymerase elongator complex component)
VCETDVTAGYRRYFFGLHSWEEVERELRNNNKKKKDVSLVTFLTVPDIINDCE